MRRAHASAWWAAVLTACVLALAYRGLHAAPDGDLIARWWPATALATILFLLRPRREARGLLVLFAIGLLAATVLAGRDGVFALGFTLANCAEIVIVLWWITRFEDGRPELRLWADYRRWLIAIGVGAAAAGLMTAGSLWLVDAVAPWRTALWIFITHVGAQATLLPFAMRPPRQRLQVSALEVAVHVLLLGTALTACALATQGQPVAFLLLPLLMWGAARFSRLWANTEVLAVAAALVTITATGLGPFVDIDGESTLLTIAASGQVFVAIGAITAVAFSVATSHLRDSLRRNREHELQLSQLVDSASGTAFIATDLDGVITWFSPGAEELLGYQRSDLVERSTPMLFHEAREVVARAHELGVTATSYEVVTAPLERGVEQDTRDWTYIRRDGERLTVSLSVTAVRDAQGRAQSHLSVVRDVTDRRAAELALRTALEKEREANSRMHAVDQAKDHFVSSVSHELRTPLTSIMGYTELMIDGMTGPLTEEQHGLVEKIERNGSRLLSLVEDLLTLSRVENGSFHLERRPTDLREAVRGAGSEMVGTAAAQAVELVVQVPDDPVTVVGDGEHLERLVLNLLSNAVKFTGRGGTATARLCIDGGHAVLEVVDTGVGIPVEEQIHLFERFFRSSTATELAIQGTGLGLNIVRSIADAHHGEVTFCSEPGVGTTFRFTMPMQPPHVVPLAMPDPADLLHQTADSRIAALLSPRHRADD